MSYTASPPMDATAPLGILDLADAELDLASWLLQDDIQLGFGNGAKETHSPLAGVAGSVSPPFIMSNGSPIRMDDGSDLNWDLSDACSLDFFSETLKKPDLFGDDFTSSLMSPSTLMSPPSSLFDDVQYSSSLTDPFNSEEPYPVSQIHSSQDALVLPAIGENQLYQSVDIASVDFNEPKVTQEILFTSDGITTPQIISVPVSDAYQPPKKPIIKTISISNIQMSEGKLQRPVKFIPYNISGRPSSQNPKPIFIKLKRMTRPVKSEPIIEQPQPTLRDIVSSNEVDDLIRDFVTPLKVEVPEYVHHITSDSGFEENSSSMFSAGEDESSIGFEQEMEAPDSPYIDEISDEQSSGTSKRKEPYSLGERRLRKKEQNKRAALRYRQKKKEEEDVIQESMDEEEQKNKQLKEKYESLRTEVALMKKLMKEVQAAKA